MDKIFKIPKDQQKTLREKPESGMGYQIIRDQKKSYIVLNLFLVISFDAFQQPEFHLEYEDYLSGDPDGKPFNSLSEKKLIDPKVFVSDFYGHLLDNNRSINHTKDSPIFNTSEYIKKIKPQSHPNYTQSFYRYNAYCKDKRVDPKTGNYTKNTYATTFNDMHHVPSGYSAVGRYALPNANSAKYVFPILTYNKPTFMETATPNFGQAGGGVEVYFETGAKNEPGNSFRINEG